MIIRVRACIWALFSTPLMYVCLFLCQCHTVLVTINFIINFEIREHAVSIIVPLAQNCFDNLVSRLFLLEEQPVQFQILGAASMPFQRTVLCDSSAFLYSRVAATIDVYIFINQAKSN